MGPKQQEEQSVRGSSEKSGGLVKTDPLAASHRKELRPSVSSLRAQMAEKGGALQQSGRQEPARTMRISTRENAAFKWKSDKSVIGALEVQSTTSLDLRAKLIEHTIITVVEEFEECFCIWKNNKLHKSFVEAVNNIPPETQCCGLINDQGDTIRKLVPLLNQGWAKKVSDDYFIVKGYRITCFAWAWSNVSGATENVRLLIRFHTVNEERR